MGAARATKFYEFPEIKHPMMAFNSWRMLTGPPDSGRFRRLFTHD
jgi:hypothetical protein